jgi:hypothetical protein
MSCCAARLTTDTVVHGSVNTRNQRLRIEQTSVVHTEDEGAIGIDRCLCKVDQPTRQQTPTEHQRLVSRITECDVIYANHLQQGANCLTSPDLADGTRTLTGGSKVADIIQQRSHHRVRSIDELTRTNRRPASSDRTARLRDNLTNNRYLQTRHAEHFRTQLPLPPCPAPRQRIPGRQRPGCNEGFSNVGLSDPLA